MNIRKIDPASIRSIPSHVRENLVPGHNDEVYLCRYEESRGKTRRCILLYIDFATNRAFHGMDPRVCVTLPFMGALLSAFKESVIADDQNCKLANAGLTTYRGCLQHVLQFMSQVTDAGMSKIAVRTKDGHTKHVPAEFSISDDPENPQQLEAQGLTVKARNPRAAVLQWEREMLTRAARAAGARL